MSGIPSCAAGVPIFQALPAEGLEELGEAMRHRHVEKGELLAAAGEPVAHLMVVARGRLKLAHTSRSGREQVVRILGPGEFLGEMALFAPARHEGDLIAVEDADVCLVPRAAMQAVLARHHTVALRLLEALAQRLAEAEQLIADLGLRDVGQRLAAELLRLAETGEVAPDGGVLVHIPAPWAELAFRLGTTPESLSRRLKAMTDQALIAQTGTRTVLLRDLKRLRKVAEA
jgi:CRP/FNR family transcriptional regulator, anaerobic regulatory protein